KVDSTPVSSRRRATTSAPCSGAEPAMRTWPRRSPLSGAPAATAIPGFGGRRPSSCRRSRCRTSAADVARNPGLARAKQAYTDEARRLATQSMAQLDQANVTPDALTIAGVLTCIAGSAAVYFEYVGW